MAERSSANLYSGSSPSLSLGVWPSKLGELGDAEANEVFALVDRDRDGTIDYQEFVQAVTAEKK